MHLVNTMDIATHISLKTLNDKFKGTTQHRLETDISDDSQTTENGHPIVDSHEYKQRSVKKRLWSHIIGNPLVVFRLLIAILSLIPVFLLQTNFTITDTDPTNTQNGVIIMNDRAPRPIVANNALEMILLMIARSTAFMMYTDLFLVFFVKCRAAMNILYQTPFSNFLPDDLSDLHTRCGIWICWCTSIHTVSHCLRWVIARNFELLVQTQTGITGLIPVIVLPIITVIMMKKKFKTEISYEIRKGLHYLFYPFALILCWHVPGGYVGLVMGVALSMYVLDSLYIWIFMTEKTSTSNFQVLPNSGVQMVFTVSESFQKRINHGGFVYVCIPWISRFQYHAFSVFENKLKPDERRIFMLKAGDWTDKLHDSLLIRNTASPVWIAGPFQSPYNYSEWYDRQINSVRNWHHARFISYSGSSRDMPS